MGRLSLLGPTAAGRGAQTGDTASVLCLTPREREIVEGLAQGMTSRSIAARLGLSYHTVETHVRNMRIKAGACSRTQLVALAVRQGLDSG